MLQQTQVKTVLPYYSRFLDRFPTSESLANASEDELLQAWQGLGYYRRVRNLHAGVRKLGDLGWPTNSCEWRSMPGVGEYTAAALASIILGERIAVVDGNVERVYSRFCADSASRNRLTAAARRWAQGLIDETNDHPGDLNQALMELGAIICTPRNPSCPQCPIKQTCQALREGRVGDFPVVPPKPEIIKLERFALAYFECGKVGLQRIPKGEWWEGMWTLPWRSEAPEDLSEHVGTVKHTVTNHRISFHVLRVDRRPAETTLFPVNDLPALPSLQKKALAILRQ